MQKLKHCQSLDFLQALYIKVGANQISPGEVNAQGETTTLLTLLLSSLLPLQHSEILYVSNPFPRHFMLVIYSDLSGVRLNNRYYFTQVMNIMTWKDQLKPSLREQCRWLVGERGSV